MRLLLPLVFVLATCWAGDPQNLDPLLNDVPPQLIQAVSGSYRLPKDVKPLKYVIKLEPTFENKNNPSYFNFTGQSLITLQVEKETNQIVLNSKNLDIKSAVLTENGMNSVEQLVSDKTTELITITLKNNIKPNTTNLILNLTYVGQLDDNLHGFYRSSYKDENNTIRWLATTQFEPTGARQAFPCWDEPAIKAKFQISIKPPSKNYHVLSNTLSKKDVKDGYVEFEETPKMSTYLVAFVVSDFTSNQIADEHFRVWSKPTVKDESRKLGFDIGKKVLSELSNFFNFPYNQSMEKMDQIAIPQFAAGAMENWGLVTYRESALLYDESVDTTEAKQRVATVIAHEFAHQWFGNVVTCKWWSSIWLNEGFATFLEFFILDRIEEIETGKKDNWRLMEQLAVRDLQASAFVVDAKKDTRALTVNEDSIQTPQQISNLFDDIAYKKGGCILRMMQQFLTEKTFQLGLREYLKANNFGSVEPKDLFDAIYNTQKSKIDKDKILPANTSLEEVMRSWVYEPGYPVVTLTRSNTSIKLTQERFFLNSEHSDNTKWYIPITYTTETLLSKNSIWLMPDKPLELPLSDLEIKNNWILFNTDQKGYYRVNYDDEGWKYLVDCLKNVGCYQNVSAVSRAQLIDDALNLARAERTSYNNSLLVTTYLSHETDYIPWYAAARTFDYYNNLLWETDVREKYQEYVVQKANKFIQEHDYKYNNGTHVEKLAKVLAFKLASKYGKNDDDASKYAKQELQKWLNNTKIWQDLKNDILCAGLQNANEKTVEDVLNKYNVTEGDEKKAILNGLGCNTNENNVKRLLETSIDDNSTIKVNVFDAMTSIYSSNPGSFDTLLGFIQQHMTQIKKKDTPKGTNLAGILTKLATIVTNKEQLAELVLLAHEHIEAEQTTKAIVSAANNLNAVKSRDKISKWIKEQKSEQNDKTNSASFISLTSFLIMIPVLLTRFN